MVVYVQPAAHTFSVAALAVDAPTQITALATINRLTNFTRISSSPGLLPPIVATRNRLSLIADRDEFYHQRSHARRRELFNFRSILSAPGHCGHPTSDMKGQGSRFRSERGPGPARLPMTRSQRSFPKAFQVWSGLTYSRIRKTWPFWW